MKKAVLYARVSSRDQEREGFSIPAQQRMLREYAVSHGLQIVKEFVDVETAKQTGRKQFGEMTRFFEKTPDCRAVIVEKTDRLSVPISEHEFAFSGLLQCAYDNCTVTAERKREIRVLPMQRLSGKMRAATFSGN